jgi:hypothetical protein
VSAKNLAFGFRRVDRLFNRTFRCGSQCGFRVSGNKQQMKRQQNICYINKRAVCRRKIFFAQYGAQNYADSRAAHTAKEQYPRNPVQPFGINVERFMQHIFFRNIAS